MSLILIYLLLAGAAMPFIFQLIKLHVLKVSGIPALILTLGVEAVLAMICLKAADESLFFLNVCVATIVVFIAAQSFYSGVVQRFFPGRGSL